MTSIPSYDITTNCRFCSNISQIFLLHKTYGNYNKFYSLKSLMVYYWYVKKPQCGYMEHGLKDIKCHVQKHIAPQSICYNLKLIRNRPLGAPAYCKTSIHSHCAGKTTFTMECSCEQTVQGMTIPYSPNGQSVKLGVPVIFVVCLH